MVLSWLTHLAATPEWRAPNTVEVFLDQDDALVLNEWEPRPDSTVVVLQAESSIVLNPESSAWGRLFRTIPVASTENLFRLQATLTTVAQPIQRFTLFPKPVLHFRVFHGSQQYPFVARPMFFQNEVRIDEILELNGTHEQIELAFITAPNSKWQLSNLTVSAVREHGRYSLSFSALIGLWGLTLLWGAVQAWRRSRIPTLAVGVLLGLVLLGVLASRDQVTRVFSLLSDGVRVAGGQLTAGHFSAFMQSGHVGLFFALTIAALIFHRKWRLHHIQIIFGMVGLAIATEALQRHAFGRSPDVQDFVFDILGIALGSILFEMGKRFIRVIKPRNR